MTAPRLLLRAHEAGPHNPRWHDLRRTGIGASEIAAVLGISNYDSPFSLYWRKREAWTDPETPAQRRGRRMEAVVAAEWSEENPGWQIWPGGLYRHPDRLWQLATPDRVLERSDVAVCCVLHRVPDCADLDDWGVCCADCPALWNPPAAISLLQIKTTGSWDGWGDPAAGNAAVPVHYLAQCLWELDVMGVDTCHLAVIHPTTWELRTYLVRRDADDLRVMLAAGAAFMRRLLDGDPPDPDWTPATTGALKRLHPDVIDAETEIPTTLRDRWLRAKRLKKYAAQFERAAENEIRDALGAHRTAICEGAPVARRTVYERKPYSVGPGTVDRLTPAKRSKD